jgi:inner membrane protein
MYYYYCTRKRAFGKIHLHKKFIFLQKYSRTAHELKVVKLDIATHALVGLTLYQTRKSRFPFYEQPAIFWATLIGSEMPDFDIVYQLEGNMAYLLNHRGITHSLPGLLILAGFFAYLLHQRYSDTPLPTIFKWTTLAGLIHIGLDALNTWGTQVFYPFSRKWVALDILPFIDIPLLFLCTISVLAGYCNPLKARRYALAALFLFSLYTGGRGLLHQHLFEQAQLAYACIPVQKISILPTINPLHWQTVAETRTAVIIGDISSRTAQINCTAWHLIAEDPVLTHARSNFLVAEALPFFRYPYLSVKQKSGTTVLVVSDLYFNTSSLRQATFRLQDGAILSAERKLPLIQ